MEANSGRYFHHFHRLWRQKFFINKKIYIDQWSNKKITPCDARLAVSDFFIVESSVSPSCRQIKHLQALAKLLRCHFLNGWQFFVNKALYFDFCRRIWGWLERLTNSVTIKYCCTELCCHFCVFWYCLLVHWKNFLFFFCAYFESGFYLRIINLQEARVKVGLSLRL